MSAERAEIAREFFEAYNRGDLDATLELIAPDFEFHPSYITRATSGHDATHQAGPTTYGAPSPGSIAGVETPGPDG